MQRSAESETLHNQCGSCEEPSRRSDWLCARSGLVTTQCPAPRAQPVSAQRQRAASSEQPQKHPKTPILDGKRAAATNRDISVGFGAGASVRRRAHATNKTTRDKSCLQKGGLYSVRVGVGTNLRIMTESESLASSASTSSKPSFRYRL